MGLDLYTSDLYLNGLRNLEIYNQVVADIGMTLPPEYQIKTS
jgi:hypothetical protein